MWTEARWRFKEYIMLIRSLYTLLPVITLSVLSRTQDRSANVTSVYTLRYAALQSQKAVSAYLWSKQILPFGFALRCINGVLVMATASHQKEFRGNGILENKNITL